MIIRNLIFLFAILLTACSNNVENQLTTGEEVQSVSVPGKFQFSSVNGLSVSARQQNTSSITLNYGEIKASKHLFLEVLNSGDNAITSINVTASRGDIILQNTPESLPGAGEISFRQISQISVEHGNSVEGIGNAGLIDRGSITGNVSFVGYTTSGNEIITVNGTINIEGTVMVVGLDLIINDVTQNFLSPDGYTATDLGGLGQIKTFVAEPNTSTIKVKNTGNTAYTLNFIVQNRTRTLSYYLDPGEVQELTPSYNIKLNRNFIQIDSGGTVGNNSLYQFGNDGYLYVALSDT